MAIGPDGDVEQVTGQPAGVVYESFGSDPAIGPDGAELAGVRFKKFGDPVAGAFGSSASSATVAGQGVSASNRTGLWLAESDGTLRELARAGSPAPGGGRWSVFEALVFPDGPDSGPIFTAQLAGVASEGITRQTRPWDLGGG